MIFTKRSRGQASIGGMVLFIAMILVATIAAGVLIQTSFDLNSKALATGSAAKNSISNYFTIRNIYAKNGSNSNINELYVDAQIVGGSNGIDFQTFGIKIDTADNSSSYIFNSIVDKCDASSIADGKFNVEYLLNGVNHKDNYLLAGDIGRICFKTINLTEQQNFIITLNQKNGVQKRMELSTPLFESYLVDIYP